MSASGSVRATCRRIATVTLVAVALTGCGGSDGDRSRQAHTDDLSRQESDMGFEVWKYVAEEYGLAPSDFQMHCRDAGPAGDGAQRYKCQFEALSGVEIPSGEGQSEWVSVNGPSDHSVVEPADAFAAGGELTDGSDCGDWAQATQQMREEWAATTAVPTVALHTVDSFCAAGGGDTSAGGYFTLGNARATVGG